MKTFLGLILVDLENNETIYKRSNWTFLVWQYTGLKYLFINFEL